MPSPAVRRAGPVVAALLAAVLIAALTFRWVELRDDMADFLPVPHTPAARLMLQELRSGPASSLILIGLEGAPRPELARISRGMAAALTRSGLFAFVGNGQAAFGPGVVRFLFEHRYLLSPATNAAAFTTEALRQDFDRLLHGLRSSAAPLVERYGVTDPPGAFLVLRRVWTDASDIRTIDGAWFVPDRDRALMLARTRAGGLDLESQDRADAAIHASFADASPGAARLLVAGPAIFARDAQHAISSDVRLLAILSAVLVAGLLLWRFRSPLVLAAIGVPVILAIAVAALAVQLVFGFVHAIAFGFGMTMLGVTVDYPVLLIGHRKRGEQAAGTLRRIGPSFNLAVASAALGLSGMVFAELPGLVQVGVFSVAGLLTAATATRWLLPRLIVAADLAPVDAGETARLLRLEHLRAWRLLGLLPVGAAALALGVHPPRIERDLANLSPVPAADRALDAELRAELGAPDVGQMAVVRGDSAEAVLRREETLLPRLDVLTRSGVIAGTELAARYVPSTATQLARRAGLPDAAELDERIASAAAGFPFRPGAFSGFADDVAAVRQLAPVLPADLAALPPLAARIQPLLFERDGSWYGLVVPRGITDPAALAAALSGLPDVTYINIPVESNRLVVDSTRRAWRWLCWGGAATVIALLLGLRDPWRFVRVLGALAAAGTLTLAALTLAGESLSLVDIVGLQFAAGVGLDYTLFFSRPQLDEEERARTLRTLITCNVMTLLTFGLLVFCQTPLLRKIGLPVALGTFSSLVFAFLFGGPRPRCVAIAAPSGGAREPPLVSPRSAS